MDRVHNSAFASRHGYVCTQCHSGWNRHLLRYSTLESGGKFVELVRLGTWYTGSSVGIREGSGYEEFVRSTFNNPSNKNYYVNNGARDVAFDAWNSTGRVLIDAKQSFGNSNYDLVLTQEWARVNVLSEAMDQVAAAQLQGIKLSWYVSNSSTAATLQTLFSNMNLPVIVKYFPGP